MICGCTMKTFRYSTQKSSEMETLNPQQSQEQSIPESESLNSYKNFNEKQFKVKTSLSQSSLFEIEQTKKQRYAIQEMEEQGENMPKFFNNLSIKANINSPAFNEIKETYDVNNYPYVPGLEPGTLVVNKQEEIYFRDELLYERQLHARTDPFYTARNNIFTAKFIDDDDVVVDVDNFNVWEYVKFIMLNSEKCTEKDEFPKSILYFTIVFLINLISIEVFWLGYIFKDLLSQNLNDSMPQQKIIKSKDGDGTLIQSMNEQTYNFTMQEIKIDRIIKNIHKTKQEIEL